MRSITFICVALLLAACTGAPAEPEPGGNLADAQARIDEIAAQVNTWRAAEDLAEATAAAEAAANLVVGPNGPGYGDRNNDGRVSGATDAGLLPGLDGTPAGLVLTGIGEVACVERDVLGGSWDAPQERWKELADAIAAWTPSSNTMPSLASHPMRIVGWATFTQTATLDEAREYGGHAAIHVDVSNRAVGNC